ncbi:MAG TPA: polysaccharide deacetylase family protein, partial [Planctomycetaceae bacterium]|nr:polysaccharide deacetylase family protein [Planctomycetaceae bacterium]
MRFRFLMLMLLFQSATLADDPAGARAVRKPIPDRLVVFTFDDASRSHYTVVRPLLKQYGFGATFFITEGFDFPTNKKDYLTWEQIKELHAEHFKVVLHIVVEGRRF